MTSGTEQITRAGTLVRFEPFLNGTAVFILCTTFLLWDVSRAVYALLALAAFVYVLKVRPRLPRDQRFFSWPIIAFFGASFISVAYDGFSSSGVNLLTSRYILLLLAIPWVSLFYLCYDPKRNPWIKFVLGAVAMGMLALVDIMLLKEYRAGGGHNEAVFGFSAAAMTAVVTASYYRFRKVRFGKIYYGAGILMGICAMFLSGTRTGWIAFAVVIILAMIFYLDRYSLPKRILASVALIVCITASGMTLPLVQERVDSMIEELTPYFKGEEQTKFTSLRYRVELWKAGWHMGMSSKVFGIGPGKIKKALKPYVSERPHLSGLEQMNHIHNQLLQTFAMSGLIGVIAFVAMVLCHLWIFTKYLNKRYSTEVRSLALSGFLILLAYLVYSIPGVPFYGKHYLMMYAFSTASIWGCLLGALQHSEQEGEDRVRD